MKYQGVFFDFDYTLGDSTDAILIGYQRAFAAMGWPEPTREQVRPTIGMTLMDGYHSLTGDMDPARAEEFYQRFQQTVGELAQGEDATIMVKNSVLLPGAVELLSGLKARGIYVALVSTKLSVTIRQIFAAKGVSHLTDLVIGGKDVSRYKPDPEGLRLAMSTFGLAPEQVLFCGDTVIDAQAARNAGVDFCAVLNGTTPREAFADYPHVHIGEDLPAVGRWLGL